MTFSMADPSIYDGASMGATLLIRDGIKGKKMNVKRAAVISLAQIGYDKLVKDYATASIAGFVKSTPDQMAVSVGANALGLAAVFFVTDLLKLTGETDIGHAEGFVPDGKGKGMSGKLMKAIVNAAELVVEQRIVLYTAKSISGYTPTSGPAAAKS